VLVLVLDSATPAITAALVRIAGGGVDVIAHRRAVDARAHGELLAPEIDEALRAGGIHPKELAAIVAGVGPGPFTGLRVGLVTAAALGQALAIPTYGVCSLDAIGFGAAGAGPILVATDARRREVYWAIYTDGRRVEGPAVGPPAEVAVRAAQAGVQQAYGDGAHRYAEALGVDVAGEPRYPPAEALAALAAERVRTGAPSEPLTPLYLRRPDTAPPAERKAVLQ